MIENKILLVDDRPENLVALQGLLKGTVGTVVTARSGREALERLLEHEFAVAVIDVQMPEMDGFELAELMRGAERTRNVPIIFVTAGAHSRSSTFRGYESGAVDFLNKPLDPYVVKSKVQVFIELGRQNQIVKERLKETQTALRDRDEALKSAREALQSRDEFLSIASHELKTPLTSLFLQLQMMDRLLKKGSQEGAEATAELFRDLLPRFQHALETSLRQSSRLASLLDELLDLTRIRLGRLSLQRTRVDLGQLVTEVFERIRPLAAKAKVDISFNCPGGVTGDWDPVRIDQVISNLLTNAIKYGGGSPVRLNVDCADGKEAVLSVEDRGPGIPADLQEKVFERFERAGVGSQIAGLGLGLYISRQIVEAHGGTIRVQSAPGEGARFELRLPLTGRVPE